MKTTFKDRIMNYFFRRDVYLDYKHLERHAAEFITPENEGLLRARLRGRYEMMVSGLALSSFMPNLIDCVAIGYAISGGYREALGFGLFAEFFRNIASYVVKEGMDNGSQVEILSLQAKIDNSLEDLRESWCNPPKK